MSGIGERIYITEVGILKRFGAVPAFEETRRHWQTVAHV